MAGEVRKLICNDEFSASLCADLINGGNDFYRAKAVKKALLLKAKKRDLGSRVITNIMVLVNGFEDDVSDWDRAQFNG